MLVIKEIEDYRQYMKAHLEWINRDRWLLFEKVIDPMLQDPDAHFDRRRCSDCIRYIEANYGLQLFPYQRCIISCIFVYRDAQLTRPYWSTFVILMARGNGKDHLIVPIGNFFQTPMFGIPEYHVDLVANSEKQIEDSYKVAYNTMTRKGKVIPKFKELFDVNKEEIVNYSTRSVLRFNTSNAQTKDGKQIGCLILNEIHAYKSVDEYSVFESAFGKVAERREFIITTQGFVRDGPLDKTIEACEQILETGENKLRYFPFLCRLESEEEVDQPDKWYKANPSLEFMPNLHDEIELAWEQQKIFPEKRPEFKTKRCCLPSIPTDQEVVDWKYILATAKPPAFPIDGRPCVLGIDYTKTTDMAGACLLFADDTRDRYHMIAHGWLCRQSGDWDRIKAPIQSWADDGLLDIVNAVEIDPDLIIQWAVDQGFHILQMACDTYRWGMMKKAAEKAHFSAEDKESVKLLRPSDIVLNVPVIESLLVNEAISVGENPLWRWSANNTKLVMSTNNNWTFAKIEPHARKNDVFMASAHALCIKDKLPQAVNLCGVNFGVAKY